MNNSKITSIYDYSQLHQECLHEMAGNDLPLSGALITDGEIQRYSADHKRNQKDEWYIAHEGISESGKPYIICIYGSWSTGEKFEYRSWQYGNGFQPNQKDLDDIKRKVAELREKSHREKLINHQEASKRATLLWKKASAFPECEDHNAYLEKKKIQPKGDIRYGTYEYKDIPALILPIRNVDGDLKSLQFIWVDEEGRIQKRFLSGGQKQECFMPLKPIEEAEEIYVCEGYATGISVQKATYRPVVVAFDSGNLESVVAEILKKYPHIRITIAADNDLDNPNNIGVKKAKGIQEKYGCAYTYPNTGDVFDGVTDFNDLEIAFGSAEVKSQLESHETIGKEIDYDNPDHDAVFEWEEEKEQKPFPIGAFPENIRNYMVELAKKVQVSEELVAAWILPAMSTAVQNLGDVKLGNQTIPLSLFTLGVADSGERKTAIIKQVLKPYKKIEMHLNEEYEKELKLFKAQHKNWEIQGKKKNAKDAVDLVLHYKEEPIEPKSPKLVIQNPTIEGISKQFSKGYPSLGLFNAEGGQIFGGFAMSKDRNLHGITSFSALWDGEPIERTRAGEFEAVSLYNKRLSVGLMIQSKIFFEEVWSNKMMTEQGFLARFLLCVCRVRVGSRDIPDKDEVINTFIERPFVDGIEAAIKLMRENFKLEQIKLSNDARKLKTVFEREVEKELALGGEFFNIKPFACKVVEQAIRIAGVLSFFDNIKHIENIRPSHWMIEAEYFSGGKKLASWYLKQIIKLDEAEIDTDQDKNHGKIIDLVKTLENEYPDGVPSRMIYSRAPKSIGRKKEKVRPTLEALKQMGKLKLIAINKKEFWRVVA